MIKQFYVMWKEDVELGGGGGSSFDTPTEVQEFINQVKEQGGTIEDVTLVMNVNAWFNW